MLEYNGPDSNVLYFIIIMYIVKDNSIDINTRHFYSHALPNIMPWFLKHLPHKVSFIHKLNNPIERDTGR